MSSPPSWFTGRSAAEIVAIKAAEDWYLNRVIAMMRERDEAMAQRDEAVALAKQWRDIASRKEA